jgi:hypothetical protein
MEGYPSPQSLVLYCRRGRTYLPDYELPWAGAGLASSRPVISAHITNQ